MLLRSSLIIVASALGAACASAPDQRASDAAATAAATAELTALANEDPETLELLTADDLPSAGSVVQCREMLRPASNVISRTCMTRDQWKIYEAALAKHGRRMLAIMRNEPYPP